MGLRVSREHGVNPTLTVCFVCGEDDGVALLGLMKDPETGRPDHSIKAPHRACLDKEPCKKCKGYMEQGVILISVRDSDMNSPNPYRTGGWVVVKDDLIERLVTDSALKEHILQRRMCFIPDAVWDGIGLPREGQRTPGDA